MYFSKVASKFTPGLSALSVFIGFSASKEELGFKAQNVWSFPEATSAFEDYASKVKSLILAKKSSNQANEFLSLQ